MAIKKFIIAVLFLSEAVFPTGLLFGLLFVVEV